MRKGMQQLPVEAKNTPVDPLSGLLETSPAGASPAHSPVSGALNREETLSVSRRRLAGNIPEENPRSGKSGQDLRVPVLNMHSKPCRLYPRPYGRGLSRKKGDKNSSPGEGLFRKLKLLFSRKPQSVPEPPAEPQKKESDGHEPREGLTYEFKNERLFLQAITHPSYANENEDDKNFHYERLEFLGDTVVNLVVAKWIFLNFPVLNEGEMSLIRSTLVSNETLAEAARKIGLHEKIRFSKGAEKNGVKENNSIIADVFEAYTAAIFLDGGLDEAEKMVFSALGEKLELVSGIEGRPVNYRAAIQEYLEKNGYPPPTYKVASRLGPPHDRTFWMEVKVEGPVTIKSLGKGRSKKEAKTNAAKNAWEILMGKEREILKTSFL